MTYTMSPCPFCGAKMDMQKIGRDWWRVKAEVWHDDECPIDDKEFDYSQSLSAIEVESIWNKRAMPKESS